MKRSHAPIFWLLFGAGGMLAALVGVGMVLITGLAGPLAWGLPMRTLSYDHALGVATHPVGKLFLLGVIALFAWHAAHRILCSLHDVGIHKGLMAKTLCYGAAALISGLALVSLWRLGF